MLWFLRGGAPQFTGKTVGIEEYTTFCRHCNSKPLFPPGVPSRVSLNFLGEHCGFLLIAGVLHRILKVCIVSESVAVFADKRNSDGDYTSTAFS